MANPFRSTLFLRLRDHLPLLAVLAFALLMRATNIVGPVRGDDFTYLLAAYHYFDGDIITSVCCGLTRVGIYFPIAIIYQVFGVTFLTGFIFTLSTSLLSVVFIYGIGSLLDSKETGLLSAFLWAAFPLDILQSTQVLPDPIATCLTAAAVFFMLLALRSVRWQRALFMGLMGFCFFWIYYVKELNLIAAGFCALYIAYHYWGKAIVSVYQRMTSRITMAQQVAAIFLVIVLFGWFTLDFVFKIPQRGLLATLALNATDFTQAFLLGNPPMDFDSTFPRSGMFDLYLPIFLLAFYSIWHHNDRKAVLFLIVWFGILLLVMEWGTDFNFKSLPVLYDRPNPILVNDRRHTLFFFVPVILILGKFFVEEIGRGKVQLGVYSVIGSTSLVWIAVRGFVYSGENVSFMEAARLFSLAGVVMSPLWLRRGSSQRSGLPALILLGALTVATFQPVPRYHAVDWQDDRGLMQEYRDAANFLLATNPSIPIVTIQSNEARLSYGSDFELGYNWKGTTAHNPSARFVDWVEAIVLDEPFFVVYEHVVGEPLSYEINPEWKQVAIFVSSDDRWQIIVYLDDRQ